VPSHVKDCTTSCVPLLHKINTITNAHKTFYLVSQYLICLTKDYLYTDHVVSPRGVHCISCLRITCVHDPSQKPLVYERLYV
jgi:hypothetical protein